MNSEQVPLLDRALLFFIEYLVYFFPFLAIYNYGLKTNFFHLSEIFLLILPLVISFILELLLKLSWIKNLYGVKLINIDDSKEVSLQQYFLRFTLKPFGVLQGYLTIGIISGTFGLVLFLSKKLERNVINFFKRKSYEIFYDEITNTEVIFKDNTTKGNVGVLMLTLLILFVTLFFI